MNRYFLADFIITDKSYVNRYCAERKKIYFIAEGEKEIDRYIKAELDINGLYNYTITSCRKDDLKGKYETNGFSSVVIPKDDVFGWMNITEREWLVRWESREDDAEYAKVLRRENFIIKARDSKTAGSMANEFARNHRYCYYEDYTFYSVTDDVKEIEEVKNNEKVRYI